MREDIQKWIDALRSGEYNQVQGTLKGRTESGEVGYCCLGVYESIHGREPDLCVPDKYGKLEEGPIKTYQNLHKILDVAEDGIDMNDEGKPFTEIADMIEEHYGNA